MKEQAPKAEPKKKHYTKEQREQLAKLAREELARQGILFSSVTGKEYDLRGDCQKLVASTDPRIILSGPRDCIIGESRIKNPITGETKTIKELCENKIRPIVQTIYGPEIAGIPFLKGYDDVFEIRCDDGSSFTATARHQVLTDCGYLFVCELRPNETHLLGYEPFRIKQVKEIIPKGKADYYDLEVPFAHHYFAEGAIHHNTGKTVAACLKAHSIASRYPRCQGVIARKTGVDLYGTVLQTFARIIRDSGVKVYGGEKPQWFDYPNGSRIWVGGLDNPGKTLSSERDFIYVNQCEELALDDWETISGSCSGRNAVIPHPQLFGDCNPGGSRHWIRIQAAAGKLVLLAAKHKDNPTIYNADGTLTSGGANRIATLEALTGVRRKRLYEGVWATSEGAVYEMFNATNTGEVSDHVQKRERKDMQKFYLALDDGFTNPAVILDVGCDSDGRWHIFREFYKSGWVQDDVAEFAKQWNAENRVELAAVDEAAAGLVEALKRKGLPAKPGKGKIFDGISKIQARLKVQKDGRPRLTIDPSCVETINEFESYIWKPDKDIPVDENNHSMGALRYLSDALNEPSGAFKSASDLMAPDVRSIVPAPHIQETEELTFDDNPFE